MKERRMSRTISQTAVVLICCLLFGACGSKIRYKKYEYAYDIPDNVPKSYSILDDGFTADVENQVAGTCWASAATTVMENSYRKYGGRSVEMDALALACMVYNPHAPEGYSIGNRNDIYDFGGSSEMVVNTTSNGFGSYVLVDSCDLTNRSDKDIKRAIMAFGGVTCALSDVPANYTEAGGTYTMIGSDSDDMSHAGVLIGWDDDFPKENFARTASQDGAWLVQNSYSAAWGDGGFYWVSYDTPLSDLHTLVMSIQYTNIASFESGYSANLTYGEETTVANVFQRSGRLLAVGTYTTRPNQHIKVTVYDKTFSEVLDSYEVTFEFEGYHTIELDNPLVVDGVAVAVTYAGEAPMEGESWIDNGIYFNASISEGQSFVLSNGQWLDLSEEDTLEHIGLEESSNNCCIKALYA